MRVGLVGSRFNPWIVPSGSMVLAVKADPTTIPCAPRRSAPVRLAAFTSAPTRLACTIALLVGVYSVKLALHDFRRLAYMEAWMLSNSGRMFVRGGSRPIG